MRKAAVWAVALLLTLFAVAWPLRQTVAVGRNALRLKRAVTNLEGDAAALNALVPFEWERVYAFPPYTSRSDIEAAVGVRSRFIREALSEGMTQLLFVNRGAVVCSVCDFPEKLGYSIDFDGVIAYDEGAVFDATRRDGVVRLTQRRG